MKKDYKIKNTINKERKLICPIVRIKHSNNKNIEITTPVKRIQNIDTINVSKDLNTNNIVDNTYNPSFPQDIHIDERNGNYYLIDETSISEEQKKVNMASLKIKKLSMIEETIDNVIDSKTIEIPNTFKYIGEYLFPQLHNWKPNDIIFINCGTGTGKTTFIKKLIESPANNYNILILTNRIANKKQIENQLKYLIEYYPKRIVIDSYQSIGSNSSIYHQNLDAFDFILCDESHFFLSDINFNQMANSTFNKIMRTKTAIKVFLSATNEDVTRTVIKTYALKNNMLSEIALSNKVWIYTLVYNRSNISKIIKFIDFDEILQQINLTDEKWLIFVKSIKDGDKYLEQLEKETNKEISFLNRANITTNDERACKTLNDLIQFEKFEDDILIATSIIDNGVNIIDRELKNIVCFEHDYIELIQEIGRKRCIDNSDTFNLYLISEKKKSLLGIKKSKKDLLTQFITVKKDLESRDTINPIIIQDDPNGKNYRKATYINQYKNTLDFNYLGYLNLQREIKILNTLTSNDADSFDKKKIWVLNKLLQKPICYPKNIERYCNNITNYLNIEIELDNRKILNDLSKNFMLYIYQAKHDRYTRNFGLDKLEDRFQEFNIPIKIIKSKKSFKLICYINER